MKSTNKGVIAIALTLVLASQSGCGKKDSDDDSGATVSADPNAKTEASDSQVMMAGKLNLGTSATASKLADGSFDLMAAQRQILVFLLLGGRVFDAPTKIEVADDGSFNLNLGKNNSKLSAVKTALATSPVDKAPLKKAFPDYASQIDAMSDEKLQSELKSMVTDMENQGGPQAVVVSYVPSGDALAEAKTFQFIGLPTSGKNVMVFPLDQMKYNIGLGSITGSGDDATAERKAEGDLFKFGEAGVTQMAAIGQTLKTVKNYWINKNADGTKTNLEGQPFFVWSGKFSALVDGGSSASAATYTGYGMYVSLNSMTDVNFEKTCPSSGDPSQSMQLIPPADITWVTVGNDGTRTPYGTISESKPFDNSKPSRQSQNGKSVCNGSGTGFYLRDDGSSNYMANWGTGGSLSGKVPTGYFNFKLDGTSKGQFDLSAGYPVDDDNNAKVPVPRIWLTKSGDNVTKVNVKLAIYNTAKKAYEDMTDVSTFKRMATEISASVSILNGNGSDERRGVIGREGTQDVTPVWNDDGTITGSVKSDYQVPLASGYASNTGKIFSVSFSYKIGSTNYRWEFRP